MSQIVSSVFQKITNRLTNKDIESQAIDEMRESFGDRVCDDLCKQLLSYLSIGDQIRLESVSKRWKRCLFGKPFVLSVEDYRLKGLIQKISSQAFEAVL